MYGAHSHLYRITDVDRSVTFYEALGFEERGRMPIRDEQYGSGDAGCAP